MGRVSGDEFGIYYRPELAHARVRQTRFSLLWRLGWTVLIVAIGAGVRLARPEVFGDSFGWFLGSVLVVGGVFAVYQLAQFLSARSEVSRVWSGLAIGVNRDGMLIGQAWYPWASVGSLEMRPGRLGASARLVATGRDASRQDVLIDYTDALPASLDSAIVALSGGRARVDLSRLDA